MVGKLHEIYVCHFILHCLFFVYVRKIGMQINHSRITLLGRAFQYIYILLLLFLY